MNIRGALAAKSNNADKRSTGSVSINVYKSYLSANRSVFKVFLVLFCFVLTQVLVSGGDYWISFWYCND